MEYQIAITSKETHGTGSPDSPIDNGQMGHTGLSDRGGGGTGQVAVSGYFDYSSGEISPGN